MNFLYKTTFVRPMSWLPAVLAVLILTGCAIVGPDYVPPKKSVSKDWHTQLKGGLTTGEMDPQALAAWWTTLNDPELSSLIDRAVLGNLDLKKALAQLPQL
jgi:multidrug efflux system outer membrane protein